MLTSSRTPQSCRVLLVDDSPAILNMLSHGLARHPEIEVVGTAIDAYDAREKIKALNPDVITLDVEMPRMNGLDFLERIMRLRPMPVVMFSSVTVEGSQAAIRALSLGAVDVLVKPQEGIRPNFLDDMAVRVLAAARSGGRQIARTDGLRRIETTLQPNKIKRWNGRIVLIGASTGGVAAIETVLKGLPVSCPPIVISQHMPESFLKSFVSRLDQRNGQRVRVATDGAQLEQGTVYIAPGGDRHTGVTRRGGAFYCTDIMGPKTNGHYPSVDELFGSAKAFPEAVIGVILTGLGRDGAEALAQIHDGGALTLGQNKESCVVYGMPRAAAELGAVDKELPLDEIAGEICRMAEKTTSRV
ncbi:protein-glutamate methylesterase/protein-glutamine glutaminase [Pseudooceanicola onchidii]|uniref:protein-glutamate methylesterase/protein-glutamine glutaminase n=1 Tax=Pseudooceanicola onchidii TaxID=2562279 RepID=UPI0010AA06FE|nr:chemotaxis response regulator protein-glutamate methylesterase [Pseudooceanicola onchidii]